MDAVLYVHGKGGNAGEAAHYSALFPGVDVTGLDYAGDTPWEAGREIREKLTELKKEHDRAYLIANSIGVFFSLCSGADELIEKAWFISPLTDMETMILGMIAAAGTTEEELREKGTMPGPYGETLSWEYLSYVREHPVSWNVKTEILYGGADELIPYETVKAFAEKTGACITVMENGVHWFHTGEQMEFLDDWMKKTSMGLDK